ncbi:MAG TPA: hypothetical protein VH134_01550 [Candidatus Dormibacteraeota bacterium]|jgi:hypothetical protein|nr:hypothetical protein [Candidatus Dormibacteraeota bacterium]
MPLKEIIGKAIGFGVVSISCILGAVLVFYGPHAYNDYFNVPLGLGLGLIGVGVGAGGVIVIFGIIADARVRQREARLHITPRPGPAGPPPAWGMGDIGRPPSERGGGSGGGSTRLMSVAVSNIDGPLIIGALLVWTVAACILWAAR